MKSFKEFINESSLNETKRNYDYEIAHYYQQNLPIYSIKQEVESVYGPISLGEIYRSLRRSGISPNRRQKPFHDDVVYYGQSGLGLEEISQLTGYSKKQVRNIISSLQPKDQDYLDGSFSG